jgi:hypothetical protein
MTLGRHGGGCEASLIAGNECAAIMLVERLPWPGGSNGQFAVTRYRRKRSIPIGESGLSLAEWLDAG